jgi:hypothetical protein
MAASLDNRPLCIRRAKVVLDENNDLGGGEVSIGEVL